VSVSGELRADKLARLLQAVGGATESECVAALQATGWDVQAAAKHIKLERLVRYRQNSFITAIICDFLLTGSFLRRAQFGVKLTSPEANF